MRLAQNLSGNIISGDSRQIYKRLDIGTAKPSTEQRRKVKHYLIDVVNVDEDFTAKMYARMASDAIRETASSGKVPLIVGGAGLYLAALTGGLFEGPSRDPMVRDELERDTANFGMEHLHSELSRIDPEASQKISPHDKIRLIRAWEVYRLTGYTISELQRSRKYNRLDANFLWLGLNYERQELYKRINSRVDRMMLDGLVDEVAALVADGLGNPLKRKRIIGYHEIVEALAGAIPMDKAIELVKQHTRNYAKKQLTWFRNKVPARWLIPDSSSFYDEVSRITDDYLNKRT